MKNRELAREVGYQTLVKYVPVNRLLFFFGGANLVGTGTTARAETENQRG